MVQVGQFFFGVPTLNAALLGIVQAKTLRILLGLSTQNSRLVLFARVNGVVVDSQ